MNQIDPMALATPFLAENSATENVGNSTNTLYGQRVLLDFFWRLNACSFLRNLFPFGPKNILATRLSKTGLVMLGLLFSLTIQADPPESEQEVAQLANHIRQYYQNTAAFQADIAVHVVRLTGEGLIRTDGGGRQSELLYAGRVRKEGTQFFSRMDGQTLVSDGHLFLAVNEVQKTITVKNATAFSMDQFPAELGKNGLPDGMEASVLKDKAGRPVLRLFPTTDVRFIDLVAGKDFRLEKLIYGYETAGDEAIETIEISYDYAAIPSKDETDFEVGQYLKKKGRQLALTKAFEEYQLINLLD